MSSCYGELAQELFDLIKEDCSRLTDNSDHRYQYEVGSLKAELDIILSNHPAVCEDVRKYIDFRRLKARQKVDI